MTEKAELLFVKLRKCDYYTVKAVNNPKCLVAAIEHRQSIIHALPIGAEVDTSTSALSGREFRENKYIGQDKAQGN